MGGGGGGQKWIWLFSSLDSNICYISRTTWWNEVIFVCWYKFRKPKSYYNNCWVGMGENVWGLIDLGALISQIIWWIEQIEWLNDSGRIILGLMANLLLYLWHLNAFKEEFPLRKNDKICLKRTTQIGVLLYFENFEIDFCWKRTI